MSQEYPNHQSQSANRHNTPLTKYLIKQLIEVLMKVLKENADSLRPIYNEHKRAITHHMAKAEIIGTADASAPTYDDIIRNFELGLLVKKDQEGLEQYCNKYLQAFVNVGGSCKEAAKMLQREWTADMKKLDLEITLNHIN
jgi:hypothetical protein